MQGLMQCLDRVFSPSGITSVLRAAACPRLAAFQHQHASLPSSSSRCSLQAAHVHSSAAPAHLQQQQQVRPNDLYMSPMLFSMRQPWKAVLVDAAGACRAPVLACVNK